MLENASQKIENYAIGDVLTPTAMNARRERIHYDFVITAEQLAAYKTQHPNESPLDLGKIILSYTTGSDGPTGLGITRPITVYIDAPTTTEDVFDLMTTFAASGKIFSDGIISSWANGYGGYAVLHIYSRGQYSIPWTSACGGIALHSDRDSAVLIRGVSVSGSTSGRQGIFRVGVFGADGTINTWNRAGYTANNPTGFTILYEKCLAGNITWEGATDTGTREPGACCAPWMSVTVEPVIGVTRGTAHLDAIYRRVSRTLSWGGMPQIKASQGATNTYLHYTCSGVDSSDHAFAVFEGNGIRLTVKDDDNMAWGSTVASNAPAIITDYGLYSDLEAAESEHEISYSKTPLLGLTYDWSNVTVLRPLDSVFRAISEDVIGDWYGAQEGSLFDFKGATALDWYTWLGISVFNLTDNETQWFENARKNLYIDVDALEEGVVYEARLHIVKYPLKEYDVPGGDVVLQQISPFNNSLEHPAGTMPELPQLQFYYHTGAAADGIICYWGSAGRALQSASTPNYIIKPTFRECKDKAPAIAAAAQAHAILEETATAKVRFVKLEDKVYIMAY